MDRKLAARAKLEDVLKAKVKAKTLTSMFNPDTGMAEIYLFDGFHRRIPWNSVEAKNDYVGTYAFE